METLKLRLQKIGTVQLLSKVVKSTGEERAFILSILERRGQDISSFLGNVNKKEFSSSKTFETEPEEELTPAEQKLIEKAEKEATKTDKVKKSGKNEKPVEKLKVKSEKKSNTEKTTTVKTPKTIKFKLGEEVVEMEVIRSFKNRGIQYYKVVIDGKNKDIKADKVIVDNLPTIGENTDQPTPDVAAE